MNKPKFDKLDDDIKRAFIGRSISKARYEKMNAEELFREYCTWYGLIGWSGTLIETLDTLRGNK